MLFSVEVLDLLLYCVQQLGVMLSVGAETIVLIAYVVAMRDGQVDPTEARFSHAVRRALAVGLVCIVASGVAITILHASIGEAAIIAEPAFLFKWALILGLVVIYLWQKGKPFGHFLVEGVIGGTWYALFLVHILAPVTSWFNLITLYLVLLLGFIVCWSATVFLTRERIPKSATPVAKPALKIAQKPIAPPKPAPVAAKIVAPPPPPPKIVPPAPPVAKPIVVAAPTPVLKEKEMAVAMSTPKLPEPLPPVVASPIMPVVQTAMVETKPVAPPPPEPETSFWLPALHIMPRSQTELDKNAHLIATSPAVKNA